MGDRDPKAFLRPFQNRPREQTLERIPKQVFGAQPAQLEVHRERGHVLDQLDVEQWHARFERRHHARPVHLRQDVVLEVQLHIEVENLVDRISQRVGSHVLHDRVGRGGLANLFLDPARQQLGPLLGIE